MKDSRKNRKRVIDFLVSRGGTHTSGANDNLFRWLFNNLYPGDYAHERVTSLREMLEAMDRDGEIVLDRTDDHRNKPFALRLPDDREREPVSEENHDLFDATALWAHVAQLQTELATLTTRLADEQNALEVLVRDEGSADRERELEAKVVELKTKQPPSCSHKAEMAELQVKHQQELERQQQAHQQILRAKEDEHRRKQTRKDQKLSESGDERARYERELLVRDLALTDMGDWFVGRFGGNMATYRHMSLGELRALHRAKLDENPLVASVSAFS